MKALDAALVARLARERGILVHTDAAQSVGKIPVDLAQLATHVRSERLPHAVLIDCSASSTPPERRPIVNAAPIAALAAAGVGFAELMDSTYWSAPSDVLLPDREFDIYQDLPELFEST